MTSPKPAAPLAVHLCHLAKLDYHLNFHRKELLYAIQGLQDTSVFPPFDAIALPALRRSLLARKLTIIQRVSSRLNVSFRHSEEALARLQGTSDDCSDRAREILLRKMARTISEKNDLMNAADRVYRLASTESGSYVASANDSYLSAYSSLMPLKAYFAELTELDHRQARLQQRITSAVLDLVLMSRNLP